MGKKSWEGIQQARGVVGSRPGGEKKLFAIEKKCNLLCRARNNRISGGDKDGRRQN